MIPFNPTIIAGAVATGFALVAGIQTARLDSAQKEIGKLGAKVEFQVSQTEEAVAVNADLKGVNDRLVSRLNEMVRARQLEREEQDRLLIAREEELRRLATQARELESERDAEIRTDPTCREVAELRLDQLCPVVAQQLRLRTNQGSGDESRDGRDPG